MLRAIILFAVVLMLSSHHAQGRLGETATELETRYGPGSRTVEAQPGEAALEYKYKDFLIMVTFIDGKSAQEIYVHQDLKTSLSETEIQLFLDLNALGKHWEKSPEIPVWSLGGSEPKDWIAMAAYFPKSPQYVAPGLGIMTIAYAKKHGFVPKDI
jgi:hypothetical protein